MGLYFALHTLHHLAAQLGEERERKEKMTKNSRDRKKLQYTYLLHAIPCKHGIK